MTFEDAYAALFNASQEPAKARVPRSKPVQTSLEDDALKLRKVIRDNPGRTVAQLKAMVGISQSTLTLRTRFLARGGLLDVLVTDEHKFLYFESHRARKAWEAERQKENSN